MNKAYKSMRDFWLDITNLENKGGLKGAGKEEILVAGIEYCMPDNNGQLKNIIVAASVLGNASIYFENNSPAGIGGMTGSNSPELKKAISNFIDEGAKLTAEMMPSDILPAPENTENITLFVINANKIFYTQVQELAARNTQNPFYKFYAYSQQLISVFRKSEEAAQKK